MTNYKNFDDFRKRYPYSFREVPEDTTKPCTLIQYTDYGGTIVDRLLCEFIQSEEQFTDCYLVESTIYNGENLLFFGEIVWPDGGLPTINGSHEFEDFFYRREEEVTRESLEFDVREWLRTGTIDNLVDLLTAAATTKFRGEFKHKPDGYLNSSTEQIHNFLESLTIEVSE